MSQIVAVNGVTGTKNNGGVAVNVGSSKLLSNRTLGATEAATGSVVVDGTDTNKALSAGTFAYNDQKPVAKRLSTTLATVSNTTLLSGALVPSQIKSVNSINSVITNKFTTAVRAGYFNIYNGKFVNTNTGGAYSVPSATDTFPTDNAANPTRSSPGSLRYGIGSRTPVSGSYKAKTG
jgi:hypothetical protein